MLNKLLKFLKVRVCVCVCVYTLPPVDFFRLHDVCDIRETFGSTIFCCEYYWGLLQKSFISISESIIFHLQRWKLQPTATGQKINAIMLDPRKDDIY